MTAVTIVGNLTRDPETRFTPAGLSVTSFGVAVGRRRKQDNEWVDDGADFYNVTAWRDLGEHVSESLEKGARVVVTGRLSQRQWEDKEGIKHTSIEVTADDVGASMRWAICEVRKAERKAPANGDGEPAPSFDPAEEPF